MKSFSVCLVSAALLFCQGVETQQRGMGDWIPLFPDQAFGSISSNDFSRRNLDTSFPGNSISRPKAVSPNQIPDRKLGSVRAGVSQNSIVEKTTPVYNLANLKQRAGVSTKNVLPYNPIKFTDVKLKGAYKSEYKRNARGMHEVYSLVNIFLDIIQPGSALPPDFEFTTKPDELLDQLIEKWPSFLRHYMGIAACIGIGVFLGILVPIVGLLICICRCAGKCGAGEEHYETKRDACKRGTSGFFFGVFLVLVAFGIVVAFVSNFNLQDGIYSLPNKVADSKEDVITFLGNTKEEVNNLMVNNYKELETVLGESLDDCGNLVRNELARLSKAVAVDELNGIVDTVNGITADLVGISKETNELSRKADLLKEDLRTIRIDIRSLIDKCQGILPACSDFERKFHNLAVVDLDQQFEKLPEINDVARNLSEFLSSSIKQEILKGVNSLNTISMQVDDAIKSFIDEYVKIQIKRSGEMLNETAGLIVSLLDKSVTVVNGQDINETLVVSSAYIAMYGPYRFYADLLACVLVLAIFMALSLGLMCGCCGSKPTSRHDGCGTRAAGASWIKCGVVQIFMLFIVLMSVVVAHFFVGAVSEKLVCDDQAGPDGASRESVFLETLDKIINVDNYYPEDTRPSGECGRNATVYEALRLYKVHNLQSLLQSLPNQTGIPELVNKLISNVQIPDENFRIITDEAKRRFEELAESGLSRSNYSNYSLLLEHEITGINLLIVSEELRRTAEEVSSIDPSSAESLIRYAEKLERHQRETVQIMQDSAKSLKVLASRIEQNIKFNETSLEEAVKKLVSLAEHAEEELQLNGSLMLQEVAVEFGKDFEKLIQDYAYRVGNYTEKEIGKCAPISKAANVPVEVLCRGVIDPLNGFWAAVGWSLIFFLICAVIGLALIDLYRKTEDYAPANTQPSYMYYAYGDRDNVPVSNAGLRPYDPPNAYNYEGDYPEFPPHVGGKASPSVNGDGVRNRSSMVSPSDGRNGRYQDSALKAWGGASPPRYSAAPSVPQASVSQEYERPPPYYYPGPAIVDPETASDNGTIYESLYSGASDSE